jgi:hypothetical protein
MFLTRNTPARSARIRFPFNPFISNALTVAASPSFGFYHNMHDAEKR